jgi:Enoyl-CoA hydratase/isomerase
LQQVPGPALIGRVRADYYFYADQVIGAEEALRLGMINQVVPDDRLLERASQIARHILCQPDANVQYLRRILTHDLRAKMHDLREYGLALEGMAAMGADWSDWHVSLEEPRARLIVAVWRFPTGNGVGSDKWRTTAVRRRRDAWRQRGEPAPTGI